MFGNGPGQSAPHSQAMPSGDRTKRMRPLAIVLAALSGCPPVSSPCAMVMAPTALLRVRQMDKADRLTVCRREANRRYDGACRR